MSAFPFTEVTMVEAPECPESFSTPVNTYKPLFHRLTPTKVCRPYSVIGTTNWTNLNSKQSNANRWYQRLYFSGSYNYRDAGFKFHSNGAYDSSVLGIMRNRWDFVGGCLGVQIGLPLLTPTQPPRNPLATLRQPPRNNEQMTVILFRVKRYVFRVPCCGKSQAVL